MYRFCSYPLQILGLHPESPTFSFGNTMLNLIFLIGIKGVHRKSRAVIRLSAFWFIITVLSHSRHPFGQFDTCSRTDFRRVFLLLLFVYPGRWSTRYFPLESPGQNSRQTVSYEIIISNVRARKMVTVKNKDIHAIFATSLSHSASTKIK